MGAWGPCNGHSGILFKNKLKTDQCSQCNLKTVLADQRYLKVCTRPGFKTVKNTRAYSQSFTIHVQPGSQNPKRSGAAFKERPWEHGSEYLIGEWIPCNCFSGNFSQQQIQNGPMFSVQLENSPCCSKILGNGYEASFSKLSRIHVFVFKDFTT